MNQIKDMLLGITIILATILIHLFIEGALLTDFIAIIGILFVLDGYFSKNNSDQTK
ncbi:hypothetical protein [uncultured Clostridium sp.]|uniref:hypothetical protein n=1 Tax=uncultured Clostridium sp. TaxID=59620 RepID=UPI0028E6E597|nr:hypothetical protein [uncultured Clostridium sp.]